METRSHKRRCARLQFRELPPEIFALVLSFHPDRSNPADPVACALRQLSGEYAAGRSTDTTYAIGNPGSVLISKTTTTLSHLLHSFDNEPAVIEHRWGFSTLDFMMQDNPNWDSFRHIDTTQAKECRQRIDDQMAHRQPGDYTMAYVIMFIWASKGLVDRTATFYTVSGFESVDVHFKNHGLVFSPRGLKYHGQCNLDGVFVSKYVSDEVFRIIQSTQTAIQTHRQQ